MKTERAEETGNTEGTEDKEPAAGFPDGFSVADEEELANLPDADGLADAMEEVLREVGVAGNIDMTCGNYSSQSGIISLDAYGSIPQSKNILMSMLYITFVSSPEWSVSCVMDADTGNYYWVPEDLKDTVDLYDCLTGELISEKSESSEDAEEEVDAQTREAEAEFEGNLEELKEKYSGNDEVPHREGMYGISDKDVYDIGSPSVFERNDVRNDVTGNWKISTIAEDVQMVDYALSYYKKYFRDDNEVHGIVNFNYNTTTCITYMGGQIYVTVHDYVKGEEHDANLLFSGTVLADYVVYADNGDIEQIQ